MIKILQVRNIDSFVESRRQKTSEKDRKTVQSILNDVRKNGDSAVKKYERKFNGRKTSQLRVSAKEIKEARSKISREEVTALQTMSARLWKLLAKDTDSYSRGTFFSRKQHWTDLVQFQAWAVTFLEAKQDILAL